MRTLLLAVMGAFIAGCATLTEDAMTPIAFSFSDGTEGNCKLSNKRGAWDTSVPSTVSVRKSDDDLKYDCKSEDGRTAFGSIPSEMGGKIVASAVFIDLGITDAITDKHRKYPVSYVIPMVKSRAAAEAAVPAAAMAEEPAAQPVEASEPAPN
jgi:hypothetical protein